MYDSVSSSLLRLARRRWYFVVGGALLGALVAWVLGAGGGDVEGRQNIRIQSVTEAGVVLDFVFVNDVDIRQVADQARIEYENSEFSDSVSASFTANVSARTVQIVAVGPTSDDVLAALSEIDTTIEQSAIVTRAEQTQLAIDAQQAELDALAEQLEGIDDVIADLDPTDSLRQTLLVQRTSIDDDVVDARTRRANLEAYQTYLEDQLVRFGEPQIADSARGRLALVAGVIAGLVAVALVMAAFVMGDRRLRRRLHLERAAPGLHVGAIVPDGGRSRDDVVRTATMAVRSFAAARDLDRIVIAGVNDPSYADAMASLLDVDSGVEVVISDRPAVGALLHDSPATGYVLVTRWGRTTENQLSAAVAAFRSAGDPPISLAMIGVPARDLDWAGVSSLGDQRTDEI